MGMSDFIYRVVVPEETVIEKKADGKEKEKIKQLFPGYVFVEMMVTDESWFVVRNTPRVTGFLGSSGGGTKPVPLAPDEINQILLKVGIISKPTYDHLMGKEVEIIEGAMKGTKGKVIDVDNDQEKVVVEIDMFGRAVPSDYKVTDIKEI
jgi:transcriptional antiterminator NusG